jgi:hypothetical protein
MTATEAAMFSLDEVRQNVAASTDGEDVACEIMNTIVAASTERMASNHLDRVAVPYTVRCVVREMLDFINTAFVGQDDGTIVNEHWHVDPQAPRILVDPWARAAVQVAPAKPPPTDELGAPAIAVAGTGGSRHRVGLHHVAPAGQKAGRSSSSRVDASFRSDRGKSLTGDGAAAAAAKKLSLKRQSLSASQNASPSSASGGGPRGGGSGDEFPVDDEPTTSIEEVEYMEKVVEDQRLKAEARQLAERMSKQMEEMKHGNFIADGPSGRVVAVQAYDHHQAHKRSELRYNLNAAPPPPPPVELAAVRPPAHKRVGPSGLSSTGPKRGAKEGNAFFQEEASYGPMVDTAMAPSGGVALRDGDQVKRADLKLPSTKVSHSEFHKIKQDSAPLDPLGDEDFNNNRGASASKAPVPPPARKPNAIPPMNASGAQQQSIVSATAGVNGGLATSTYKSQGMAALPTASTGEAGGGSGSPKNARRAGPDAGGSSRLKRSQVARKGAEDNDAQRKAQYKGGAGKVTGANMGLLAESED